MSEITDEQLFSDTQLYEQLGIEPTASKKDINRAYRKLALKYHPDQNQGNADAATMFVKIKKISEFLLDDVKRGEYDKRRQARAVREEKFAQLNDERKRMREALAKREEEAKRKEDKAAQQKLREAKEELLRYEMNKRKRDMEAAQAERESELKRSKTEATTEYSCELLVKWKDNTEDGHHGLRETVVRMLFGKVGPLRSVAMSAKKPQAIVSYHLPLHAAIAAQHDFSNEGFGKIKVSPIGELMPLGKSHAGTSAKAHSASSSSSAVPAAAAAAAATTPSATEAPPLASGTGRDYESITLMRMRQAEERKRLAAELAAADDE